MRLSTAVAILSLAAGVALSVALPLPAMKSGGSGVNLNEPRVLSSHLHPPSTRPLSETLPHQSPHQNSLSPALPPSIRPGSAPPSHLSPQKGTHSPPSPLPWTRPSSEPLWHLSPHQNSLSPSPPPWRPGSAPPSHSHPPPNEEGSQLHHPQPSYAYTPAFVHPPRNRLPPDDPYGSPSPDGKSLLFDRADRRIKLAARAYVRELLTTPMDGLD